MCGTEIAFINLLHVTFHGQRIILTCNDEGYNNLYSLRNTFVCTPIREYACGYVRINIRVGS
jgi:hypothetical protein